MTAEQMIQMAMKKRAAGGLKLTFYIPDEGRDFTCYPKDEDQKAQWLADALGKGWSLKA
jgi:hypothetical protein